MVVVVVMVVVEASQWSSSMVVAAVLAAAAGPEERSRRRRLHSSPARGEGEERGTVLDAGGRGNRRATTTAPRSSAWALIAAAIWRPRASFFSLMRNDADCERRDYFFCSPFFAE